MTTTINKPWDEDEIEFLPGDWEISRGEYIGLYTYVAGGRSISRQVDASQLVDWGMAKRVELVLLSPWEGSDIEFSPDVEIIRDPADVTSKVGKRDYLMIIDKKLCRVNKYYLIQNKLATGGAVAEKEISAKKVDVPKASASVVWEGDDIILTPPKGLEITRAYGSGVYRFVIGGVSFVRTAAQLISEGKAKPLRDLRLEKLSACKAITFKTLREDLSDFWQLSNADEIKTLHDVARSYYVTGLDGAENVEKIIAQCEEQIESMKNATSNVPQLAEQFNVQKQNFDEQLSQLSQVVAKACSRANSADVTYFNVSWLTDVEQAEELCNQAQQTAAELQAELAALNACAIKNVSANVNAQIFPENAKKKIVAAQQKVQDALAAVEQYLKSATNCVSHKGEIQKAVSDIADKRTQLAAAKTHLLQVDARKKELDAIKSNLPAVAHSKKAFHFGEDCKTDGLVYLSKMNVSRQYDGRYKFWCNGVEVCVTATELCYLGLAKRK